MGIKNTDLSIAELKQTIRTLQFGPLSLVGQALRGSNSTFLTDVGDPASPIQAIYKPSKGERPLWDFPDFTLAFREVAAFIVSTILRWELVPPTVLRTKDAIYGTGSLQLFVPHDPTIHFLNSPGISQEVLMKVVLFDILINNADRKAGHVIFDSNQKPWLIDHGLCFNQEFKYRSVIWDFAGSPIPDEFTLEIKQFIQKLKRKNNRLIRKLNVLLSDKEVKSMINRANRLVKDGIFPNPEPNRRSYPWPPI